VFLGVETTAAADADAAAASCLVAEFVAVVVGLYFAVAVAVESVVAKHFAVAAAAATVQSEMMEPQRYCN